MTKPIGEVILTVAAGSHAHGINTATSDYDYVSVAVAPLARTLGIDPQPKTQTERTAPAGVRSSAGDVEHVTYELRHYVSLAAQGNPSMLVPLFVDQEQVCYEIWRGESLRDLAPAFVSMRAVRRHLGYLDAQRARMIGSGPHQSRKPNRPELVAAHGFDTKYAAHALRLGLQGVELAETGRLQLPMEDQHRATLLALRGGELSETEALALIDENRDRLRAYVNGDLRGDLPPEPDLDRINDWLVSVQLWMGGER